MNLIDFDKLIVILLSIIYNNRRERILIIIKCMSACVVFVRTFFQNILINMKLMWMDDFYIHGCLHRQAFRYNDWEIAELCTKFTISFELIMMNYLQLK